MVRDFCETWNKSKGKRASLGVPEGVVSEEWIYNGAILNLWRSFMRHHVPKWYHDNLYPLQGPHDSRANPETEANPPKAG